MLTLGFAGPSRAEVSVDLLYDFRHTPDPQDNANNFPVVELKLFFPSPDHTQCLRGVEPVGDLSERGSAVLVLSPASIHQHELLVS